MWLPFNLLIIIRLFTTFHFLFNDDSILSHLSRLRLRLDEQLGAPNDHSLETASFLFLLLSLLGTVLHMILSADMQADHTAIVARQAIVVTVITEHHRGSLQGIMLSVLPTGILLIAYHLIVVTPLLRLNTYLKFAGLMVMLWLLQLLLLMLHDLGGLVAAIPPVFAGGDGRRTERTIILQTAAVVEGSAATPAVVLAVVLAVAGQGLLLQREETTLGVAVDKLPRCWKLVDRDCSVVLHGV